jgi:hypothetical protein
MVYYNAVKAWCEEVSCLFNKNNSCRNGSVGSMMRGRFIAKKIASVGRLSTFFVILFFLSSCITVVFEPSLGSSQKVPGSTSPQMKSASNPDEDAKQ